MTYEIEVMQKTFDDYGLTVKQVNVVEPNEDDNNQITVIAELTAEGRIHDTVLVKVNAYDADGNILAVEEVGRLERENFCGYNAMQTNLYDSRVVEKTEKIMLYAVKY